MKLFSAAAVSLALLTLGSGASLAQSAPPLPSVIGLTSPLQSPYGGDNNVQGPASQNSSLPYSSMAVPCSMANPGTSALPTFDGGGFTLSVGTTMSGLPPGTSSAINGALVPCPTVSPSGIAATASTNSASTPTSATATAPSGTATNDALDDRLIGFHHGHKLRHDRFLQIGKLHEPADTPSWCSG